MALGWIYLAVLGLIFLRWKQVATLEVRPWASLRFAIRGPEMWRALLTVLLVWPRDPFLRVLVVLFKGILVLFTVGSIVEVITTQTALRPCLNGMPIR
jgi:hypothetical protein